MNYHFKDGSRKDNVLQQLQMLDQDLMKDKQQLEKLKLQAQFYQDKAKPATIDKQSLADQIMNELINDPYKPKYNPSRPQSIPTPQYNSPPKEYVKKPIYQPQPLPERQNNLVNQREMQKMKLQNQKHQGLFPTSSDNNRVRSLGKNGAQIIPEKDRGNANYNAQQQPNSPKKARSPEYEKKFDPAYNPFVKDDTFQKQQKQQRNRQYLKELQQQRLEQDRQKKARMKEQKQIKVQNYEPMPFKPQQKTQATQKPLIMKRSDPNNRPPKIQQPTMGNYSQFDKNLIRSKLIQLKSKFKKGKIIYEEYERQRNNLRKQYPGDIQDLEEAQEKENKRQYSPPKDNNVQPHKNQDEIKIQSKQNLQEPKKEPQQFPIRNQSINYSQFMPSMVQPQPSYSAVPGYHPSSIPQHFNQGMYSMLPPPSYFQGPPPTEYIDLLKKLFDFFSKEVKQVKTQQTAQVHALQQTLNKFMQINAQQQNFMTQQIPPIPNQLQRQFYSDAKQHRQYFEKESNIKKKVLPSNESLAQIPFGESDNSEYYDKSLSGIASKIPLNQANQRMSTRDDEKSIKVSALDQFYSKKYKIKAFKKFNIILNAHQSQLEIPSTSSYFRAKNAKEELKNKFQQDLSQLKKMQKDKNMKKFQGKLTSNSQYSSNTRVVKDISIKLVGSQPFGQQISPIAKQSDPFHKNPYLKKHVSTQDNIMTFNNKELKINSPTGYTPISKKEILEQDEYLTQPKIKEEIGGAASLINQYEERLAQPVKALNFIKMNNQVLSKYDKTQQSKKDYITIKESVKQVNSRDYFVNNQISPVKAPDHYEQSLQTIRSDFQSVKQSARPKVSTGKFGSFQNKEIEQELDNQQIIQTVESVDQSSSKLRRPPIAKRRSVGRKKETSITRSRPPYETNSNMQFSGSQQVDQSMGSYHKFDSNVYESNYQESVNLVRPNRPKAQLILASRREQIRQTKIQLNPPTFITPKAISPAKQVEFYQEQSKIPSSKSLAPQNKWKSLEQARKLAKQGRVRGDQSNYRSVEQKFSQLESFITKKGDQSQQVSKVSIENVHYEQRSRIRSGKSKQKQPVKKQEKRNILKLLEQLQDDKEQDYKQQFQSYREQSQQYQ